VGNAGLDLVAEALQLGGDDLRRPLLLIAELGVLMKVAAPRHDLRRQLLRHSIDLRRQWTARLRARGDRKKDDSQRQQNCSHSAIVVLH